MNFHYSAENKAILSEIGFDQTRMLHGAEHQHLMVHNVIPDLIDYQRPLAPD